MTCKRCEHQGAKRFGTYGKAKVQRYRCPACKATFSETRPRPLGNHYTDTETTIRVLELLTEGMSVRAVSRLTGLHKSTILALMVTVGESCRRVFDTKVRGLHVRYVQADETWTYVHTKQRRLRRSDPLEWGDTYLWIAFDSESKMVLSYFVGKRDSEGAYSLMDDLAKRIEGRFQISTDGLDAYINPIEEHFGTDATYAQLVKVYRTPKADWPDWYSPSQVVSTYRRPISGNPIPEKVSTSHVERMNLNVRTFLRRFTRLSLGFSKKLSNLQAMVAIFMAWYNLCRVHGKLRVTPGMECGITDHVWTIRELVESATQI